MLMFREPPKPKEARPHQSKAIAMLRASLQAGKRRPVLQLPTGAGKTLIAAKIIASALAKGKRILFVVDAIQLIDQTVDAFYAEGLTRVGVIQADHPMTDWSQPIQVASIQTLVNRTPPPFDLCIIDECHEVYEGHKKLMESNQAARYIGLSATPWTRGLGLIYDDLIKPVTVRELTDLGYVARLDAYAPSIPDLSGVEVRAGEYNDEQLSEIMRGQQLIADIVQTWQELGEDRPTLAFCVDRAHARAVQERFDAAGVGCGYIDGTMDAGERLAVRRDLEAERIKIVVSVGTMIKGVDWKFGTIIDAQPRKSIMRHVQKLGRLRPFAEWPLSLVLDHSGNTLILGLPMNIDKAELCCAKKGERTQAGTEARAASKPKLCPNCNSVKCMGEKVCPCGHVWRNVGADIEEGAGSLARVGGGVSGPKKREVTPDEKLHFYRQLLGWCALNDKPTRQADGKFKDRFGHWPAKKNGVQPTQPTPETLSWIKASQIRWAKGKGKQA